MLGWIGDVQQATLENTAFRSVLFTGEHTQLTVMRLAPGEDIGREAHPHLDQRRTRSTRRTTSRTTGRSSSRRACGTTSSTRARAT